MGAGAADMGMGAVVDMATVWVGMECGEKGGWEEAPVDGSI